MNIEQSALDRQIFTIIYTPMITIINVCRCTPSSAPPASSCDQECLSLPIFCCISDAASAPHCNCSVGSIAHTVCHTANWTKLHIMHFTALWAQWILHWTATVGSIAHNVCHTANWTKLHIMHWTVNPSLDCLALSCHKSDAPQPFYTFICTHHHFHLSLCICIPSTWLKSLYLHSVYFKIVV